ncbi:EAL domain-containing protein [Vibrio sp. T187]|uniref:EAL domain-containing protein n=1 Tax=Vibrio TaxID=662 RepID=UPI0010C96F7B|nr:MULTISPECIES: EAL domain-containing protein [Vibrio]MBW3698322.1 EAL domain-containing protein [Vibrio sp. T187]
MSGRGFYIRLINVISVEGEMKIVKMKSSYSLKYEQYTLHSAIQPIINDANEIYAYEFLLRVYSDGVFISPEEFMSEYYSSELDLRIVTLHLLNSIYLDTDKVFINVYPETIMDCITQLPIHVLSFAKLLIDSMYSSGKRVYFEIVENECDVVGLNESIQKLMRLYDTENINFVVDDFCFIDEDFERLNIDNLECIKIDSSQLMNANLALEHKVLQQMVGADIPIVFEGVETLEELNRLLGMGFRLFQGYLFKKPQLIGEHNLTI